MATSREQMLGAIRRALSREGVRPGPVEASAAGAPRVSSSGGDIQKFEAELAKAGGRFFHAATAESAREYIVRVAVENKANTVAAWETPLIDEIGLRAGLARANVECVTESVGEGFISRAAACSIGVTGVDFALAETGSLVLLAGKGRARSVSLLPPIHIAIVRRSQVIPGFDELFARLPRGDDSSGTVSSVVTFITGPSRTADIELTLVVGVHGPQQLHVVLTGG